ncbi:MAG: beta-lactamase [Gammaproteobacteria bacterium (ex Lamellibrachia satsuma)]|nr:MAG: FprA family A-type flavoprotein [Gammaproteobacteria bacterium (ex Lamellibrachia satsuma)]RRS32119.1 MAG: beta-lactamase [Gammaproteobacteria bacterium (ex Lamellibrachia satsuma)]RRS34286.1 MAG: beta-lactamase [Gammaproteobacteria bacterium (ex Lamellibrachia satsuma)]
MSVELYNKKDHICVAFRDLVTGDAVQANQFLIFDHGHAALLDPGGELTYSRLFMAISDYMNVKKLDYVIASHQDPDIVASVNKWLVGTDCKVVVPSLWERFIPHFTRPGRLQDRVVSIPDQGINLELGNIRLKALPAHFLHAEGNFQFYDPISKILFSGDLGANLPPGDLDKPVKKLAEILPYMDGFHKRYMNSNRVCRYWANMVSALEIEMIVPQHGRSFVGKKAVAEFINWVANLECGIDLMTQSHYQVP